MRPRIRRRGRQRHSARRHQLRCRSRCRTGERDRRDKPSLHGGSHASRHDRPRQHRRDGQQSNENIRQSRLLRRQHKGRVYKPPSNGVIGTRSYLARQRGGNTTLHPRRGPGDEEPGRWEVQVPWTSARSWARVHRYRRSAQYRPGQECRC